MSTALEKGTLQKVVGNLRKEIEGIKGRSMQGLINAAIIIRRDMEQTPPKIPIATGNLRSSWTIQPIQLSNRPTLLIGFTANYAIYVHENYGANFNQETQPGAGAGFLVASLKRNKHNILGEVKKAAKVKR